MNIEIMNSDVTPGIHPYAHEKVNELFSKKEHIIVNVFKRDWYVTKADSIKIGSSDYKFILIKAPNYLANQFNILSEIIVVFSEYEKFEPRTFDAFDYIKDKMELGRVENLCGVLVSNYVDVEKEIKTYNSGKETRTIIPFSYDEICNNKSDTYIFRNKFQRYFYNRDLFAFDDALKTDLYFFGRNQLVMDIINRHLQGQNTGLFGLRKTGKTSIMYDVKRKIKMRNAIGVFLSCQNPEMSMGTWVDSIYYIVKSIYKEVGFDESCLNREAFTELTATGILLKTTERVHQDTKMTILLMFDEVEHITYGKSASNSWGNGLESVYFWKAVRSAFQMQESYFTYCIVGTNPICIEYPTIEHADNPIFCGVTPLYIPGFDIEQTRGMVRKLGRIMGIKFEEGLYAKMTEEYGGHPFLIRHVCSYIAQKYPNRPVTIDRIKYNKCREEFNKTQGKYFDMLLEVLQEFYPMEYDMLVYLAVEDYDTFKFFAEEDYSLVQHLMGYGIITQVDNDFDFKMDVIKEYVIKKENIHKKLESVEDKWSYLCSKRGNFEIEMRKMVKQILLLNLSGEQESAKEYVITKLFNDKTQKRKYNTYDYKDLFDPKKCNIYLKDLSTLITGKWELFAPFIKDVTQEEFVSYMRILNKEGRFEAHAKIPSENDMILFDAAISKLGSIVNNYKALFE